MAPPRLTLVRTTSETNDNAPDDGPRETRAPGEATAERSAPASGADDPRAAAATALADLARSALAAADVVNTRSAGSNKDRATAGDAAADTPAAARAAEADPATPVVDDGSAASAGETTADAGPMSVSDPEAPPAATASQPAGTTERAEALRILEALLFAASEPLDEQRLAGSLGQQRGAADIAALLADLQQAYASRGVNLVRVAGKWAFRTAEDLSWLLERHATEERRLSKAALETLSIIAYHQPVTRAEIEDVRGVSTSAGTLDILLETGWVRPRGRRRAPGRPVTYGTTDAFLAHFGLDTIKDLPGLAELKGAGLLDTSLPPGFTVPEPCDVAALMPDELPLDSADDEEPQPELELELDESLGDDGETPAEPSSTP